VLLVEDHDTANIIDSSFSWVIDSGASIHVTFMRDIFLSYMLSEF